MIDGKITTSEMRAGQQLKTSDRPTFLSQDGELDCQFCLGELIDRTILTLRSIRYFGPQFL